MTSSFAVVLVVMLCCVASSRAITFKLDPHAEECFFEQVPRRTKVLMHYLVVSGGSLDVDVTVKGPQDKVLYEAQRETEGRVSFTSDEAGPYSLCFSNRMSTVTQKGVTFNINVGDMANDAELAKAEHLTPLENSISRLADSIRSIQEEQVYMRDREAAHRNIAEDINARVQWWSIAEAVVLLTASAWQIYYIRRIVDVRRTV